MRFLRAFLKTKKHRRRSVSVLCISSLKIIFFFVAADMAPPAAPRPSNSPLAHATKYMHTYLPRTFLKLTVLPEVLVESVGGVVYGGLGVRNPRPERLEGVLSEGLVRLFLVGDEGRQRLSDVVLLALERTEVRTVLCVCVCVWRFGLFEHARANKGATAVKKYINKKRHLFVSHDLVMVPQMCCQTQLAI